jgi:hypothetical protein
MLASGDSVRFLPDRSADASRCLAIPLLTPAEEVFDYLVHSADSSPLLISSTPLVDFL